MSDLIDRQKAIDAICNAWCGNIYNKCAHPKRKTQFYYCDGCYDVEELEKLSSEQSYRQTGEWIPSDRDDIPYGLMLKCSVCGEEQLINDALIHNFCSNCGADMRG